MAKSSEQISQRWVEGLERVCVECGTPITNLAKQVGEIRHYYTDGKVTHGWIRCVDCRPQTIKARS